MEQKKNKKEVQVEKQIDFKLSYWLLGGALFLSWHFILLIAKVLPQYVPQIVPRVKPNVPDPFVMEKKS